MIDFTIVIMDEGCWMDMIMGLSVVVVMVVQVSPEAYVLSKTIISLSNQNIDRISVITEVLMHGVSSCLTNIVLYLF